MLTAFSARPLLSLGLAGLLAAAGAAGSANAQQIYKIVGPDGRVTFSDKPPNEADPKAKVAPVVALPGGGTDLDSLPFELRQAAIRYPVTLYTTTQCAACGTGRAMLMRRGIPFSERTVNSNEDIEAMNRIAGSATLPFLTIGGQQLKGYSEGEWTQFLDAAGYPKNSQLPASYSPQPAAPLVVAQQPNAPARPTAPPRPPVEAAPPPPPPAADNPAGIKF